MSCFVVVVNAFRTANKKKVSQKTEKNILKPKLYFENTLLGVDNFIISLNSK